MLPSQLFLQEYILPLVQVKSDWVITKPLESHLFFWQLNRKIWLMLTLRLILLRSKSRFLYQWTSMHFRKTTNCCSKLFNILLSLERIILRIIFVFLKFFLYPLLNLIKLGLIWASKCFTMNLMLILVKMSVKLRLFDIKDIIVDLEIKFGSFKILLLELAIFSCRADDCILKVRYLFLLFRGRGVGRLWLRVLFFLVG